MAATLIHIKSRMLLPADEEAPMEEMEDPRLELVQRLLEYQAYKDAATILKEKEEVASGSSDDRKRSSMKRRRKSSRSCICST